MNKHFKKLAGAVTASLLCLIASAFPLSASATIYDDCDVNHDGDVDILDTICLSRYLNGTYDVVNYKQMDANQNCVVDEFDYQYVLDKITNITTSQPYYVRRNPNNLNNPTPVAFPSTGNDANVTPYPNNDSGVYDSRWYSWATYQNNTLQIPKTDYCITPTQTQMNMLGDEINAQVGNSDTRYFAQGTTFGEITGVVDVNGATGFIVGDHEIVTAAHMVITGDNFNPNISVKKCNFSGKISTTPLDVKQVHVPRDYMDYRDDEDDYALIVVSNSLSSNTHFAIGEAYNVVSSAWSSGTNKVPIYVTGQPQDYAGGRYFKTDSGDIYSSSTVLNTLMVHYTTDTFFGDSGAPIYTITAYPRNGTTEYQYTAIGVHAFYDDEHNPAWFNYGAVFTKYHRLFFLHNPKDTYITTGTGTSME